MPLTTDTINFNVKGLTSEQVLSARELHGFNKFFIALITANISLTLVNRSFYYSIISSAKKRNYMVPMVIFITITITFLIFIVKKLTAFFEFEQLNLFQVSMAIITGFILSYGMS